MKHKFTKIFVISLTVLLVACLLVVPAFAAKGTFTLNGVTTSVEDASSVKESGGTITVTIAGWWMVISGTSTSTITVKNDLGAEAVISFQWTQDSNIGSLTIDGAARTSGGTFTKRMAKDETIDIVLVSQKNTTKGTVTFSNFKAEAIQSGYETTFIDPIGGTVTVGGEIVSGNTVQNVPSDGVTVDVTPLSGYTFYGWVDASQTILSTNSSFTYKPKEVGSVKPILANATDPVYRVGSTILFDDLKDAPANSIIVLAKNATLPAGTHTIEKGSTLLIPFDDANTLYTNAPETDGVSNGWGGYNVVTYVSPTPYRTLTMATGANLVINGAVSLSAKHHVAGGGGRACGVPVGPCSFVEMNSGSSITINNGGYLYSWGYIKGSGQVIAKNGSTVYEYFAIEDFMGGTTTNTLNSNALEKHVFPFRSYYIQNILVPLTIEAGAVEKGYTSIHSGTTNFVVSTEVPFVGSNNSMFTVTNGYLVKSYDAASDRCVIDVSGAMSINSMTIKVYIDLASANFDLPITSNMIVNINSGTTTTNQSLVVLPGARVTIAEGASFEIALGKRVILYDLDQWSNYVMYDTCRALTYLPGRTKTFSASNLADAEICVNGTLDASAGSLYTTAGGANIYSTGSGKIIMGTVEDAVCYQYYNNSNYVEHVITSAQLKNADGTYSITGNSATSPNTYTYTDDKWVCETHTPDPDNNNTCKVCGYSEGCEHADTDKNHKCDTCQTDMATHEAAEGKHTCDYCNQTVTECADTDKNHKCDTCQTDMGTHEAAAGKHTCDYCSQPVTQCADTDKNHKCDTCQTDMGTHEAAAGKHTCDYCSQPVTQCADTDKNHKCDTCQTNMGTHEAAAGKHTCDYCSQPVTQCADTDKNHKCDTCNAVMSNCSGGEATCTERAVCEVCEQPYGDPLGHTPGAAATCTTAQTCTACGVELVEQLGHTPAEDDGDCTTAIKCTVCGTETTPAKQNHTPAEDDGNCLTAIKCTVCGTETTPAKQNHTPAEDDGNCLTAVACTNENCTKNAIEAMAKHNFSEKWENDKDGHWHACENSECTQTEEKASHNSDGAATEEKAETCTECGYEIAPALVHSHDYKNKKFNEESHWFECACGEKNGITPHSANQDDGDCTTEVTCSDCAYVIVSAEPDHVAGEDDGDCMTAVKCVNCEQNAVEATSHIASEDDGDCTTAVKCVNCDKNAVEATSHVAGQDDGDCTTAVKCVNCEQNAVEATSHVAGEDDGDCTTAVKCVNCDKNAVEATSHVAGEDDGDCTTAVKCVNCDKNAVEATSHVAGEDDGDCTTAVKCTNCDKNAVEAKEHTPGAAVKENEVPASCGADGSYEAVVYCVDCETELDRETVTVPATGEHNYVLKWNESSKWEACGCGQEKPDSRYNREYTFIFKGYDDASDIELEGTYQYGSTVDVPTLALGFETEFFHLEGNWMIDGQTIEQGSTFAWELIYQSLIENSNDRITIPGTYRVAVEEETIQMSATYGDDPNSDVFLTLSLFIIVDEGISVKVNLPDGLQIQGGEVEGVDGLYHYSLPLTAEQLNSSSATLTVQLGENDDVMLYSNVIELSLLSYSKKADGFLGQEDLSAELIKDIMDYGQAIQVICVTPDSVLSDDIKKDLLAKLDVEAPIKITPEEYTIAASAPEQIIAKFKNAYAVFDQDAANFGLGYSFTLDLPENAVVTSAGILLAEKGELVDGVFTLIDGNKQQKTNEKLNSKFGKYYDEYVDEVDEEGSHKLVTISNVPVTELSVQYVTIYVEYTLNGEARFAYSQTIEYGVTTYLSNTMHKIVNRQGYTDDENAMKHLYLYKSAFDIATSVIAVPESSD